MGGNGTGRGRERGKWRVTDWLEDGSEGRNERERIMCECGCWNIWNYYRKKGFLGFYCVCWGSRCRRRITLLPGSLRYPWRCPKVLLNPCLSAGTDMYKTWTMSVSHRQTYRTFVATVNGGYIRRRRIELSHFISLFQFVYNSFPLTFTVFLFSHRVSSRVGV